jgi:hypothetical protein
MRLKSEIWVKAYIRSCLGSGAMAVVVRHGDDDAGAIYIRVNHLDGKSGLYGPAPAGFSDGDSERRWSPCLASAVAADDAVEAYLERQARSDPDLWIVEVEARDGTHHLDDWLA